jgi:AcrR family transcriptional regulator
MAMSETTRRRGHDGGHEATGSRRAPRQARAAETRRRLLEAGSEAFAAKGFDGVNLVEDVLEPAGISIGSFYHQFADKTELLREILAEAAAHRRAFIVGLAELDPAAGLEPTVHLIVERLYGSLEQDADAWQLQRVTRVTGVGRERDLGIGARDDWNDELAQLLRTWFDRPADELRRAADLVVTIARGLINDFLDAPPDRRRPSASQMTTITAFVVGGLTAVLGTPRPPTH